MTTSRIASLLSAVFALAFGALSFQGDAHAYEVHCDLWVDTGDLPACLSFQDASDYDYAECNFQLLAVNDCDEEIQLAFFCEESERECPHATAVKAHSEEVLSLGRVQGYDVVEQIQVVSLPLDAAGTIHRNVETYDYYWDDCGTHMGCSAAGQGPGSVVLMLLALAGLVAVRRR